MWHALKKTSIALCSTFALVGCGPSDDPPPFQLSDGSAVDTGSTEDAGIDTGTSDVDAGELPDSGRWQGRVCRFEESDRLALADYGVYEDAPALAVRNDGALVAWVLAIDAQARVSAQWIPTDGGQHNGLTVTPNLSNQRDPVIVTKDDGFVVAWRDDVDGDFELASMDVSTTGVAVAEQPAVLTVNTVNDRAPSLARAANGEILLAWAETSGAGTTGKTLRLSSAGTAVAPAETVASLSDIMGRTSVVPLQSGWAFAWAADDDVYLQALNGGGAPRGEVLQANLDSGATGSVSATYGSRGGAVAYDIRPGDDRAEVRLRTFATNGELGGFEQILTVLPEGGVAGSIASFGPGYAFSYYSDVDRVVRLALVDEHGETLDGVIDLGESTVMPSATTVAVSPDGNHVFVAWTADSTMRLAHVRCE